MSLLLQIALGAIIAGGIGFGVWSHEHHRAIVQQPPTTVSDQSAQVGAQANVNLTAGTTNADLDKDMSSIDEQLNLVNQSSVESDQSMNDKPITQ